MHLSLLLNDKPLQILFPKIFINETRPYKLYYNYTILLRRKVFHFHFKLDIKKIVIFLTFLLPFFTFTEYNWH
jgi:hypothetical protein